MASQQAEELAAMAGFTVAFFAQDKSRNGLWQWFNVALKENWTGDRLLQQLRQTNWFKGTAAATREAALLRTSDPAEYRARVQEMVNRVQMMAAELGIPLGKTALEQTVNTAFLRGWNDQQIRMFMGQFKGVQTAVAGGKLLGGSIGAIQQRINAAIRDYGVRVSPSVVGRLLNNVVRGLTTEEDALAYVQTQALSAWPGMAEQISAGQTVREVAAQHISSMAELLEISPDAIDLYDPRLRGALSVKGQDGKFSMMSLPDFETHLRKNDPRWMRTDNAQDAMAANAHEILKNFGMVT